jgi:hypothetical protein
MAFGGPNPGIWGDSVRKALNPNEERGAHEHEAGAKQLLLDKAELRELERSGVYGEPPPAQETPQARQPSRLRSLLARVFRRPA